MSFNVYYEIQKWLGAAIKKRVQELGIGHERFHNVEVVESESEVLEESKKLNVDPDAQESSV